MCEQEPSVHTTQVLPPLLTLKFLILGRLFRLRVIALEGDKNLASESILKLLSLKDLHAADCFKEMWPHK